MMMMMLMTMIMMMMMMMMMRMMRLFLQHSLLPHINFRGRQCFTATDYLNAERMPDVIPRNVEPPFQDRKFESAIPYFVRNSP